MANLLQIASGEGSIVRQSGLAVQVRTSWGAKSNTLSGRQRGCEVEIVRAVGNELVAKGLLDFAIVDEESTGHALDVARRKAGKIAVHPGKQHAGDALAVQILTKLRMSESKSFIEFTFGIGKPRQVVEFIGSEEFRSALLAAQVNKSERSSLGLDLGTETTERGDRLAAKGSTKVPEKDQEQATRGDQRFQGLAARRAIGAEQLGAESLQGTEVPCHILT